MAQSGLNNLHLLCPKPICFTVVTLESVFSVRVNNVCTLFCKGKQFEYDEQAEIGLKQVCLTDDKKSNSFCKEWQR